MRLAVTVLVIGDHFLRAGANDAQPRVPIGTVGGDLQLQHRIAMPRVLPVLHDEHFRAAERHRLLEEAGAAAEIIDDDVEAREQCVLGGHGASFDVQAQFYAYHPSLHNFSAVLAFLHPRNGRDRAKIRWAPYIGETLDTRFIKLICGRKGIRRPLRGIKFSGGDFDAASDHLAPGGGWRASHTPYLMLSKKWRPWTARMRFGRSSFPSPSSSVSSSERCAIFRDREKIWRTPWCASPGRKAGRNAISSGAMWRVTLPFCRRPNPPPPTCGTSFWPTPPMTRVSGASCTKRPNSA